MELRLEQGPVPEVVHAAVRLLVHHPAIRKLVLPGAHGVRGEHAVWHVAVELRLVQGPALEVVHAAVRLLVHHHAIRKPVVRLRETERKEMKEEGSERRRTQGLTPRARRRHSNMKVPTSVRNYGSISVEIFRKRGSFGVGNVKNGVIL
ncbi:uncharacterized protein [Amphiura filiformis]|uniref:uncharacterized protein n=1 Tax=Amphiura filiformis TaxID=82378 RepID=UPI003B228686